MPFNEHTCCLAETTVMSTGGKYIVGYIRR